MWADSKLKADIAFDDTSLALADNIGFEQVMVGDTILVDHPRSPEQMTVTGFDEAAQTITVERGASSTTASAWKKGTRLRLFRIRNGTGTIVSDLQDLLQEDGTTKTDQLTATYLTYDWQADDTTMPGCFWLEFKLTKLTELLTVEWVRRFPSSGAFMIKIVESPTVEI